MFAESFRDATEKTYPPPHRVAAAESSAAASWNEPPRRVNAAQRRQCSREQLRPSGHSASPARMSGLLRNNIKARNQSGSFKCSSHGGTGVGAWRQVVLAWFSFREVQAGNKQTPASFPNPPNWACLPLYFRQALEDPIMERLSYRSVRRFIADVFPQVVITGRIHSVHVPWRRQLWSQFVCSKTFMSFIFATDPPSHTFVSSNCGNQTLITFEGFSVALHGPYTDCPSRCDVAPRTPPFLQHSKMEKKPLEPESFADENFGARHFARYTPPKGSCPQSRGLVRL